MWIRTPEVKKINALSVERKRVCVAVHGMQIVEEPAFDQAARPEVAQVIYDEYVSALRLLGVYVQTGVFQAQMSVELTNDGPVTILLDSAKLF